MRKKFKWYTWVNLKSRTESDDEIFLKEHNSKKFYKDTQTNSLNIYMDQNQI